MSASQHHSKCVTLLISYRQSMETHLLLVKIGSTACRSPLCFVGFLWIFRISKKLFHRAAVALLYYTLLPANQLPQSAAQLLALHVYMSRFLLCSAIVNTFHRKLICHQLFCARQKRDFLGHNIDIISGILPSFAS